MKTQIYKNDNLSHHKSNHHMHTIIDLTSTQWPRTGNRLSQVYGQAQPQLREGYVVERVDLGCVPSFLAVT